MTKTPETLDDRDLETAIGGSWVFGYQALPELDANLGGSKAPDAYIVKCDSETTTQAAGEPHKTSTVRGVQIMK